jgi:hypothetical protein
MALRCAAGLVAASVALTMSGCKTPVVGPTCGKETGCRTLADCNPGGHLKFYCEVKADGGVDDGGVEGCCVTVERPCGPGVDAGLPASYQTNPCCPGQVCSSAAPLCADTPSLTCSTDQDCASVAGWYCDPNLGVYPSSSACTFHTCNATSDCDQYGPGLQCFNSYCVGQPPCGGGCPATQVCTPVTNTCYQLGSNASATCSQSCAPGSMLVFKNGLNVFDFCNLSELDQCECLTLPNVESSDTGRFSSAALTPTQVLVSAYDGQFGDLVMHTFDRNTLAEAPSSPVWIDGLPTTGNITGNPAGPRGGRAEPGPNVGEYTSIAYDSSASATHISYYGVANGTTALQDLRYARQVNGGNWVIVEVDGSDASAGNTSGDVGRYSSITLAPDGSPVIAYFQAAGTGANLATTALKVARAKTPTPMSSSDWWISTIDTGTTTPPPCGGQTCPGSQVCAAQPDAPYGACLAPAASTACTPACGSGQTCVTGSSNTAACVSPLKASGVVTLPQGNGLMPSITYLDQVPMVVWYDQNNGQLKGLIATADASPSTNQPPNWNSGNIQVLDDGTGRGGTPHDVGQFPSVAVGPTTVPFRIAVTYMDATANQLLMLTAHADWSGITPQAQRIIDNGVGSPPGDLSLFVGAHSSVHFIGSNVVVAYQDSTTETLRLGTQSSPTAAVAFSTVLASSMSGADGFYASLATDGTTGYVSHLVIVAANATQSANQLLVTKVP